MLFSQIVRGQNIPFDVATEIAEPAALVTELMTLPTSIFEN